MRIAFHAPLKPPDAPTPSGDRTMARLLSQAMREAGHEVELATRFRSRDGGGDPARQFRLRDIGQRLAARYVESVRSGRRPRPDLWFTYHVYYKAPDWIGPSVADALDVPYVIAEASVAHKRAGGPWDAGHRATLEALSRADLVIGLNSRDRRLVAPTLKPAARYLHLRPFLDLFGIPSRDARAPGRLRFLAVGMMRQGDKTSSYLKLAEVLTLLETDDWQLTLVGDGPMRARIAAAFAPFGARVTLTGALDASALADAYRQHDLFVWPAIREAYGMALLEAQAHGLAAVAGDAGGVPDIVRDGVTGLLAPEGDAEALAARLELLIRSPGRVCEMGGNAARIVVAEHGLTAAAVALDTAFRELVP